ncbi:MAG: sulfotransferase [Pirellulaceae bacterium]
MSNQQPLNRYPSWSPTFAHGLRTGDWLKLAARARFRIAPSCIPRAAAVTLYSLFNTALAAADRSVYGRRVEQTELTAPPVFIIGHWRTGTTLLHELLARDERFACANTYQCMAPHHFLLTENLLSRVFRLLAPARRPMDDMPAGVERPQEDDIALLALGAPTPLRRVVFPNELLRDADMQSADMPGADMPGADMIDGDESDEESMAHWREAMSQWLKRLTTRHQKRLLLKSPPHTGKIAQLAELFPGAKFIHLVRSPHEVFDSTRRLWRALDQASGMQIAHHRDLDEQVFTTLRRMYTAFERQRPRIAADNLCDVAYEHLIADPLGEAERIYTHLALGDFTPCRPPMTAYLSTLRNYRPNRHQLDAALRRKIDHRWADYAQLHQSLLQRDDSPQSPPRQPPATASARNSSVTCSM